MQDLRSASSDIKLGIMQDAIPPETTVQDDDPALFEAFRRSGDREALLRLFQRHVDAAYLLALRLSGNTADAEDAVQEGFIEFIASAHRYRGEGSLRSWILSIVANTLRRQIRTDMRRNRREQQAASQAPTADPGIVDEQARAAALACLAELPDRYRLPVTMRCLDGLEFADITAALGIKEKTLRSQVGRGLEMLREMLLKRGIALSALAVTGLLTETWAATPPSLLQGVQRIAETTPIPAASPSILPVAGRLVAALVACGLAALLLVAHLAGASPVLQPAAMALPPPASSAADRVALALDRVELLGFHAARPEAVIDRILDRLPRDLRIPIAFPGKNGRCATCGGDQVDLPFGEHRLREVLELTAASCGLTVQINRIGVVLHHRLPEGEREALIAAFHHASSDLLGPAAEALAASGDLGAIRHLVLALAEEPARVASAARALGRIEMACSNPEYPHHLDQHLLQGLADDAQCRTAVLMALRTADLPVETRRVAIQVAGYLRLEEVAELLLPQAQAFASSSRVEYRGPATGLPDAGSGGAAMMALGFLGGHAARNLVGQLSSDAGWGNLPLCAALGRLGDPVAAAPLMELHRQRMLTTDPRLADSLDGSGILAALARTGNFSVLAVLTGVAAGTDKPASGSSERARALRRDAILALGILEDARSLAEVIRLAGAELSLQGETPRLPTMEDPSPTAVSSACREVMRRARRPGILRERQQEVAAVADPRRRTAIALLLADDADAELGPMLQAAIQQDQDPGVYREGLWRLYSSPWMADVDLLLAHPPAGGDQWSWPMYLQVLVQTGSSACRTRVLALLGPGSPERLRLTVASELRGQRDRELRLDAERLVEQESDPLLRRKLLCNLRGIGWSVSRDGQFRELPNADR